MAEFRIEGLDGVVKTLLSLPPEIVSKRGGPIRASARAALNVIRKQEIQNLDAIIAKSNEGGINESTGLLRSNIVISRSKPRGGQKGERFLLRIRKKVYAGKSGKPVVTSQVARLLEYGTELRQPYPFIRPAFESKKSQAVSFFVSDVNKRIAAIIKKLEQQNRVAT